MEISNWYFSGTECKGNGIYGKDYFKLPNKKRIVILMYHLDNILIMLSNILKIIIYFLIQPVNHYIINIILYYKYNDIIIIYE
jgi:hypothetical protein